MLAHSWCGAHFQSGGVRSLTASSAHPGGMCWQWWVLLCCSDGGSHKDLTLLLLGSAGTRRGCSRTLLLDAGDWTSRDHRAKGARGWAPGIPQTVILSLCLFRPLSPFQWSPVPGGVGASVLLSTQCTSWLPWAEIGLPGAWEGARGI